MIGLFNGFTFIGLGQGDVTSIVDLTQTLFSIFLNVGRLLFVANARADAKTLGHHDARHRSREHPEALHPQVHLECASRLLYRGRR